MPGPTHCYTSCFFPTEIFTTLYWSKSSGKSHWDFSIFRFKILRIQAQDTFCFKKIISDGFLSLLLGPLLYLKNIFSVSVLSFHFSVLSISANDGDCQHFSIGMAFSLGPLKAPSLADTIDPLSHHSQEGCLSKALLAPGCLLLPSTHPQPPKRAGCCTFTGRLHPAVQKHAASWQQWDSKAPGCIWATSSHQDSWVEKENIYCTGKFAVLLTVSLSPLLWSWK